MDPLYETIGFTAGAFGLSIAIPQLVKTFKTKTYQGVNTLTWLITLASFTTWTAYSLRYHSLSQTTTNLIAWILTLPLVYLLLRQKQNKTTTTTIIAAITTLMIWVGYYSPEWLMTVTLFTTVTTLQIPQILSSVKNYKTHQKTSVSKTTYTFIIISSTGWITYGYLTGLWQNIISSSISLTASLTILIIETRKR